MGGGGNAHRREPKLKTPRNMEEKEGSKKRVTEQNVHKRESLCEKESKRKRDIKKALVMEKAHKTKSMGRERCKHKGRKICKRK